MKKIFLNKLFNSDSSSNLTLYEADSDSLITTPSINVLESQEKYLLDKNIDNYEDIQEDKTAIADMMQKKVSSVSIARNKNNANNYFYQESKFVGEITSVDRKKNEFTIQVNSSFDKMVRELTFPFAEVEEKDYSRLTKGRRVIFVYGKNYVNGTQYNVSKLYLRDDIIWSKRELEKRRREMMHLFEGMDDEDET